MARVVADAHPATPPRPGRLRRNPKHGRVWYRLPRTAIPKPVTVGELARRLYAPAGPRDGRRPRSDVIDKRAAVYAYLCRRARSRETRSGQWAAATSQVIRGLMPAMAELDAKPWDRAIVRQGDEQLLYHYATVVATLLDDLAAIGLLRWGGARDNNGLWWRLEIELLDNPWDWQPPSAGEGPEDVSAQPPAGETVSAPKDGAEAAPIPTATPAGGDSFSSNSEEPYGAFGYAEALTSLQVWGRGGRVNR